MSRAGRPSARGAHKRNLIGPAEMLRRIEEQGGLPEELVEDMKTPRPPNPRAEAANDAMVAALEGAKEFLPENFESDPESDSDTPDAFARRTAWILSVMTSMKESAPRKTWCRHMRAADPHLTEIRTMAVLSAGVWLCVECMAEQQSALKANPWPDECDLCGATIAPGHFNEMAFNVPGCFVNCSVCDECAGFRGIQATEP